MRRAAGRTAVVAMMAVAFSAAAGFAGTAMQGTYGDAAVIQARELAERIEAGGVKRVGFYWVDLRNEADYKKSFIPGSINIPSAKFSFLAEKFFSKSDEVVFMSYADSDHISVNAVIFMKNKGFLRCSVLKGGVGAWTGDLETAPRTKN